MGNGSDLTPKEESKNVKSTLKSGKFATVNNQRAKRVSFTMPLGNNGGQMIAVANEILDPPRLENLSNTTPVG